MPMKPDLRHGLHFDLPRFAALAVLAAQRRQALRLLAGLGLGLGGGLPLLALAADSACRRLPAATAGPFPADGSNRTRAGVANVLALADVVRSDIRSSIGGLSGSAAGVPMTLTLALVNSSAGCAACRAGPGRCRATPPAMPSDRQNWLPGPRSHLLLLRHRWLTKDAHEARPAPRPAL